MIKLILSVIEFCEDCENFHSLNHERISIKSKRENLEVPDSLEILKHKYNRSNQAQNIRFCP